ncbi:MAG: amino acid permease [Candidatus Pacearchaeota archaeon]|nr:amino acid permease [Candidatus Pacearchaeota archaeon]
MKKIASITPLIKGGGKLKKELGLFSVTVAGVGIILGAGIYALIGIAAGETGNTIWLSFLISAIVAAFTGLSYAELSSIFKGDAGEYDYINAGFGRKLAGFVSLLIIFTGVVSSAAVALGFAGYLSSLIAIRYLFAGIAIVMLMAFLNYWGIKESNKFNLTATTIEFLGLVIIILLGIKHFGSVDLFEMPNGFFGVLKTGALLFFAFMGFETIVKLSEEAKNPEKTIPKAIILSVVITAILYILVAISAVSILPVEQIAGSKSPLADVAAYSFGGTAFIILAIIALFSTSNTVLLTMLTTSRMVYGMAERKFLPKIFSKIHKKRGTPYVAVFAVGIVTVALTFFEDIGFVADLTTVLLFATFALINLVAIVLRYKKDEKRVFRMPLNIGKFPVLSLLGVITSLIMLVFSVINIL